MNTPPNRLYAAVRWIAGTGDTWRMWAMAAEHSPNRCALSRAWSNRRRMGISLTASSDEFRLQAKLADRWKDLLSAFAAGQTPAHWEVANWYTATHPDFNVHRNPDRRTGGR